MTTSAFQLCTESLGFESGDCSVGEGEEQLTLLPSTPTSDDKKVFERSSDKKEGQEEVRVEGKRKKSFPPPLRWMSNQPGKQSSYMKSERRDGRLILTEVWLERPEVFQVTRENGRLRFSVPLTTTTDEEAEEETTRDEEMEAIRREGFCSSYQGEWRRSSSSRMHDHHTWWRQGFVTTA